MKRKNILILGIILIVILIGATILISNSQKTISGKLIKEITQAPSFYQEEIEKDIFKEEVKLNILPAAICFGQDSEGYCKVFCEEGGCSCEGSQCECTGKVSQCEKSYEVTTTNFWGRERTETKIYYNKDPLCCFMDPGRLEILDKY